MPYRRPPQRRNQAVAYKNRYHSKYRWRNYSRGVGQLANDVWKLKQMVNVEYKNHDVEVTSTSMDVDGSITALNYVNQGDGTESRDGSMFRLKSLEFRYLMSLHDSLSAPVSCRMIIFLDTDPDGSTPTLASLLDDTTNPHISPRNLDSRSRYVIYKDVLVTLNPNGLERVTRKIYKKLDLKVLITGGTASAANMKKNGLYVCFLSSQTAGATYKPTYLFNSRVRYIDN